MVTLQDISIQLMKPAKDLADWKFPLSQMLEEYYALLEEPCDVNFGEAALVLQNSTNVYARRIECLLNETEVLKQTFFGYEEEELKKSRCGLKKLLKKTYSDIENFVITDIEKSIGKLIDKKNQFQAQKKIKLLSHRFTQLENNITQLYIPIEVCDVLGEVIGKKYDFRCNQAIDISGMLVDELTPHDFSCIANSYIQEARNSLSLYSKSKTDIENSEYHSVTLSNDIAHISNKFEDERNSFSIESNLSVNEVEIIDKENMINNNNENLFVTNSILNHTITKRNMLEKQSIQECAVQTVSNQTSGNQHRKEVNQIKKGCQTENSVQINETKVGNQNTNKNIVQFETRDQIGHNKQLDHIFEEDQIIQSNESDNVRWKEELPTMQRKGNQTTKMSIWSVDDLNECDWKPMPLIQGINHAFSDNISIVKLPNYITFLETEFGSKKRKFSSNLHKPKCLTKFILYETELFTKKDLALQTTQKFRHLQKQDLEDFMENFDQCLIGAEKRNDAFQYKAVTNIAVDLLGFHISQSQDNFTENNIDNIISRNSSPIDITLQSTICQNSVDMMEKSPNSCNNWCELAVSETDLVYSLPDYQSLIEDKMKEIFKETNVTTELDQAVARWHASLESKLSEEELRPAFRIHEYASHIIGALQALEQKRINFDSVVQDKPAYEVARYFLASLQLANTYNVEIKAENNGNTIEIALLNEEDCKKN